MTPGQEDGPPAPRAPAWRQGVSTAATRTLAAGVGLGVVWRVVAMIAASASDAAERGVSADGTFFVLATVLGVATAVVLWRRPGPVPAVRLAVVLVSAVVSSALAVAVSWILGGPVLAAWGGLVVWPWVTAMIVATVATVRLILPSREAGTSGRS